MSGTYIQLNAKGIEPDLGGNTDKPAVIIPFDNFDNVIQNPGKGFFNTLPSLPHGTSTQLDITINLVNPTTVTDANIIIGNFDPFLIRNKTRSFEIHRADFAPTAYADASNFGTGDDNSSQSQGKWYRTHENLPWALDLPIDFNYPAEFVSIVDAYPEFKGWAQSSGASNQTWYNNPSSEPGFIYPINSSGNSEPTATNVSQSGTTTEGQTLTGSYTYHDADSDPEGTSLFKWYRADDVNGTNEALIAGATAKTYVLQAADANKYIRFGITPVALTGILTGTLVKSQTYSGPITNNNSFTCGSNLIDTRDGKVYKTVQISNQCWMKENLNIGIRIDTTTDQSNNGVYEKFCYANKESNCDVYGGLYQWRELMQYDTTESSRGICPDGRHVPSVSEFEILSNFLGGDSISAGKMKSTGTLEEETGLWEAPNIGATNSSGFSVLPSGGYYGFFSKISTVSFIGTSTKGDMQWNCWVFAFVNNLKWLPYGVPLDWHNAWSVRCLKDNGTKALSIKHEKPLSEKQFEDLVKDGR